MNHAILFQNVMQCLWGDDEVEKDFVIRSIVDKLRGTARCNYENAFDVLDRIFGENIKPQSGFRAEKCGEFRQIFDVYFDDDSQCLIEAHNGIGSSVEVL